MAKKPKPKKTTSTRGRKKKIVETPAEVPSVDAIVVAPRLSMCDGKKKRFEAKIREQNGIRSI